jgi:hypothetical protein
MKRLFAMAAVLALAACSSSGSSNASQSASAAASPTAAPSNPTGFPLYSQSTLMSARPWHQSVGSRAAAGEEVIAESSATLAQLTDWIHQQSANPPSGFSVAASGSSVESARSRATRMGIAFQVFSHDVNGKPHALIVVALDPVVFEAKAGPLLDLAGNYKLLPAGMRDPLDAQAKERTGFTVSEALDASTPIGAALAAARTLRDSGQRGIVLIDGTKN